MRHWYIDFGDSFGSEWTLDGFSRRHGHAYILDMGYMLEDFPTFGAVERPWDRAHREPGLEIFTGTSAHAISTPSGGEASTRTRPSVE